MKIISLLLFWATLVFAEDIPLGGYRNFEQFQQKKPTIPARWSLKSLENSAAESGHYVTMIYLDTLTGLEREWKRPKDGKIWAYVDSSGFYYSYQGILSKCHVSDKYAWFYGLEELISDDFNSGIEGTQWHEDVFILDLKKNKRKYLTPKRVRKLISSNKELLKEFEAEENQRGVMVQYLNRYFEK